jgi:hypothetical protein
LKQQQFRYLDKWGMMSVYVVRMMYGMHTHKR